MHQAPRSIDRKQQNANVNLIYLYSLCRSADDELEGLDFSGRLNLIETQSTRLAEWRAFLGTEFRDFIRVLQAEHSNFVAHLGEGAWTSITLAKEICSRKPRCLDVRFDRFEGMTCFEDVLSDGGEHREPSAAEWRVSIERRRLQQHAIHVVSSPTTSLLDRLINFDELAFASKLRNRFLASLSDKVNLTDETALATRAALHVLVSAVDRVNNILDPRAAALCDRKERASHAGTLLGRAGRPA